MANNGPLEHNYISIMGRLKRAISGIVPPKEVEDIVQEAYVRACQADRDSPISSPRSFLFKTVRNLAIDHMKRAETRLSDGFDEDETDYAVSRPYGTDPLTEVVNHQEFSLFCEAVRLLPPQCRRAFVLKKVYGYSRREIAELMGVSENTVQTQIARGMKSCTQFMDRCSEESTEPGRKIDVVRVRHTTESSAPKDELG
ncbi:MAG: RNA polymerase subunit sigma-70 [Haliea sp.]|nr:RNA polymerase subunit sigma-70 [Haliea sp.]MAY91668.1 RNA polymerase subunit sigma-70 [Haliea sp.]MBP69123.1 RNA polymerase subunit sigma-70 [Haliea sp.]